MGGFSILQVKSHVHKNTSLHLAQRGILVNMTFDLVGYYILIRSAYLSAYSARIGSLMFLPRKLRMVKPMIATAQARSSKTESRPPTKGMCGRINDNIVRLTNKSSDCIAWKRTVLFCFSTKSIMRPPTQVKK